MDFVYSFEDQFGNKIKLKKINADNEYKEIWQIYNSEIERWTLVKREKVISFYHSMFVQERKILIEKNKQNI